MDAITLSVKVGEDRRLVVDLPAEIPVGMVDLTIKPHEPAETDVINPAREAARAKLLAGGALSTWHRAPEGAVELSDEELEKLGQLAPGALTSDQIIDEERGEY
ncbi:MAG: hypothetical protein IT324_10405 [Anaerolineae bacterium]|nr:hypothetical protein [Anaerolineae bacterium]